MGDNRFWFSLEVWYASDLCLDKPCLGFAPGKLTGPLVSNWILVPLENENLGFSLHKNNYTKCIVTKNQLSERHDYSFIVPQNTLAFQLSQAKFFIIQIIAYIVYYCA